MSYLLSNAKVYIKDNLASTLWVAWTFRISVDLERSLDIETATEEAFFVLKNGTQIERFLITATWGVATIVKRGLEQDWVTENAVIQKPWWEGSIGYITMKPADLLGSGQIDDPFTFNGDVTFNNPVTFTESIKIPVYANAAARDVAIPSPANGMSVYLTAEWYFTDYQAWAWSSRAAWATTVNATTTVAGKVELPTTSETQGLATAGWTWAPLVLTLDQFWNYYPKWDGSDWNATISSNTSLSRDMYYNNLTVNTWINLDPAWYAIYVAWTLTLTGTAKIVRNWNPWWVGWNAVTWWAVWAGWTAWVALATGTCGPNLWGATGWAGGDTSNWTAWTAWTAVAVSYATAATNSVAWWTWWNAWTFNWGTGGALATVTTRGSLYNSFLDLWKILALMAFPSRDAYTLPATYGWLPSSGWGGGGAWHSSAANSEWGWGGWSGWNWGNIMIFANILAGTGTIESKWWAWWAWWNWAWAAFYGWGGWGGWGGCWWIVVLVYNTGTPYTITVTGWAWWAWGGWLGLAWAAGATGTSGTSIVINK